MTERNQVYKCDLCGNIIHVLHASGGELACCGQAMTAQIKNTAEASTEKHIPTKEIIGSKVIIKIGEVEHPMTEDHYIEWVEVVTSARSYVKYFTPGEKPFAEFNIDEEVVEVKAYCNLHGLWSNID